ncbi:S8 family peptidase [Streptomyces sp. NPDC001858]
MEPAQGREHIRFLQRQDGGNWTVIPLDVLPLLAADRIDKALFDVSALVEEKYADRASLPLIVEYAGAADAARRSLTAAGAGKVRTISGTSFATLSEDGKGAADFWKGITSAEAGADSFGAGIQRVWLDGRSKVQLDRTVARIGAPQAWEKGYKGDGVKVAVLDTGFDANHPDLKGLIAGSANFTAEPNTDDLNGHGTHVTSTVAGSGAASGGTYKGVAPGARILSGKVCTANGWCDNSDIIEGMAWAAQQGAKVINLSVGDTDTAGIDVLEAMVDTVTRDFDTLVVAAAGNGGSSSRVSSPASADRALAVGATQIHDDLAKFTSIGPRVGDFGLKPDLVAPGVDVVAAKAGGTTAEDGYTELSGTSMSTPHVVGAAAILFQQHPDWTPEQVKRQLMQTTTGGFERGAYYQGAGRVDIARAITQQVTAEPSGLSFGHVRYSDSGRPPVSKTLTYRNPGSEPLTFDLALNVTYLASRPAPKDLFRLSSDKVTVPAHGFADVTLTATPEATTVYGALSGVVIASTADKSVSVRTPLGIDVEQPSYDLRLNLKDRSGKAPAYANLLLTSADGVRHDLTLRGQTELVTRVLKGKTYSLSGFFLNESLTETTVVGAPEIVMGGDRSVTIDARQAKPVTASAPSRSARIASARVGTIGLGGEESSPYLQDVIGGDRVEGVYAVPTARVKNSKFAYVINTTWAEPGSGGTNPSPAYYLLRPVQGGIPADPGYHPRKSELATVNSTFAATAPGTTADRYVYMRVGGALIAGGHAVQGIPLPSRRVDYFSAHEGASWDTVFIQASMMDPEVRGQTFVSVPHSYKGGTVVEERWNNGVQAMGFSPVDMRTHRDGDVMTWIMNDAANGNLDRSATTTTGSQRTWELRRNGEPVPHAGDQAEVPADAAPADYRLTFRQQRDLAPGSSISTDLRAEWRFRSQTTSQQQALPLYAVRMSPELDEWNRAKSGRSFDIPVQIQRPVGAAQTPIRTFTTEVSYDEGKTWHDAKVKGFGDQRTVSVKHPRHPSGGAVSLRTYVKDAAGNSFKQTVIKAYLLK